MLVRRLRWASVRCSEILDQTGYAPQGAVTVVDFSHIPHDLSARDLRNIFGITLRKFATWRDMTEFRPTNPRRCCMGHGMRSETCD